MLEPGRGLLLLTSWDGGLAGSFFFPGGSLRRREADPDAGIEEVPKKPRVEAMRLDVTLELLPVRNGLHLEKPALAGQQPHEGLLILKNGRDAKFSPKAFKGHELVVQIRDPERRVRVGFVFRRNLPDQDLLETAHHLLRMG